MAVLGHHTRAILNLFENTHPPGFKTLNFRILLFILHYKYPNSLLLKNVIIWAASQRWEQFQICSVFLCTLYNMFVSNVVGFCKVNLESLFKFTLI